MPAGAPDASAISPLIMPITSSTATGMRAHSTRRSSSTPHTASTIPITTERYAIAYMRPGTSRP